MPFSIRNLFTGKKNKTQRKSPTSPKHHTKIDIEEMDAELQAALAHRSHVRSKKHTGHSPSLSRKTPRGGKKSRKHRCTSKCHHKKHRRSRKHRHTSKCKH